MSTSTEWIREGVCSAYYALNKNQREAREEQARKLGRALVKSPGRTRLMCLTTTPDGFATLLSAALYL